MARLGKRERAALREVRRIEDAELRLRQERIALAGAPVKVRTNFDNLWPITPSRVDWSYNWKHARRIAAGGKW